MVKVKPSSQITENYIKGVVHATYPVPCHSCHKITKRKERCENCGVLWNTEQRDKIFSLRNEIIKNE